MLSSYYELQGMLLEIFLFCCCSFRNQIGLQAILDYDGAMYEIVKIELMTKNMQVKIMILDLLAAACLLPPNGHAYVLVKTIFNICILIYAS
jgi:hypothetical protein